MPQTVVEYPKVTWEKMDLAIKHSWLRALRSGEYLQCQEMLEPLTTPDDLLRFTRGELKSIVEAAGSNEAYFRLMQDNEVAGLIAHYSSNMEFVGEAIKYLEIEK